MCLWKYWIKSRNGGRPIAFIGDTCDWHRPRFLFERDDPDDVKIKVNHHRHETF